MPKATYMYWQKRFDRENPDKELEERILEIRKFHKDYGYRRMLGELRNQNIVVNKKKVQRIMQKLGLQVTSFTRKSRKYSSYKEKVGTIAPNRIRRRFNTHIPRQKITTDTTEFKYYEVDSKGHMTMHKLYLDPFMDMCNGEILSFGILAEFLTRNRNEVISMSIFEYDKELEEKKVRKAEYEAGFSEGEKHGIELNSIETAKRMLTLQEFSLEKIAAITGLPFDEVKKLQANEAKSDS